MYRECRNNNFSYLNKKFDVCPTLCPLCFVTPLTYANPMIFDELKYCYPKLVKYPKMSSKCLTFLDDDYDTYYFSKTDLHIQFYMCIYIC